ncbi:hypothetical protein [Wolbachia endosymbiont of Litomosoides sigmodontis]|nr:hypothetical protein [Wolbachia endosymbiont of Litomosoides sigmodontis]
MEFWLFEKLKLPFMEVCINHFAKLNYRLEYQLEEKDEKTPLYSIFGEN